MKRASLSLRGTYYRNYLRTFARNFSNIDFFLKILPVKVDELVMVRNVKKLGGHRLRFRENMPGSTPKSEKIGLR